MAVLLKAESPEVSEQAVPDFYAEGEKSFEGLGFTAQQFS